LHSNDSNEKYLITLFSNGNEGAFEELYRLYSKRLFGYFIKFVKSEIIAADLLQDAFIKIWNNRQNIDPEKSFRAYLFRIAENLVYDFFRKAARNKKLQVALINSYNHNYSHVEEDFSVKENEQFLKEAINALPPKRRQVFQLIKIEERSYEEVSETLHVSTSTINDHVVKATKAIRENLESYKTVISILFCLLIFAPSL
jgi:RNA polymerase sigma-70 factor (family 1)